MLTIQSVINRTGFNMYVRSLSLDNFGKCNGGNGNGNGNKSIFMIEKFNTSTFYLG